MKPALRHKGSFMHTDCVPKEKPTGDSNPPAGHTDSVILPSAEKIGNHEKHFATLRAAFALRGHRLELAFHGESKEPTYYAERWAMVHWLPTLHDTALLLAKIGERL